MKPGRLTIYGEAQILAERIGKSKSECLQWMKETGVNSVSDLKSKWPELTFPQCLARAEMEIERSRT